MQDRQFTADDILVTERLFSRAARRPDLIAEAHAFKALSEALLIDSATAIQRFVDLALELCPSADSAGLSELEQLEDGGTQFRWTALSGVLAPFVKATVPRHSPCGLCLDAHHAILARHPARCFDFIGDLEVPMVECLVVPLYDTRKEPLGTIWIMSHRDGPGFNATDMRVVEQLAVLLVLGLKLRKEGPRAPVPRTLNCGDAAGLIVRIAAYRDRVAFSLLFAEFAPKIKALMLKRGFDGGRAEDCAQETLLAVWRKADQFDPTRASAAAWIFTIARNRRVDVLRREVHSETGRIDEPPTTPITPEQALKNVQSEQRVRSAIDTLPPEQAEVLRRSFYGEETHAEIAANLRLPLGTVKSRIRLAAAHLRTTLDGLN